MVNFCCSPLHHRLNQVLIRGPCRQRRNFTVFPKNQGAGQGHHKLFQLFVIVEEPVFGQGIPHDVDVFHDPLFVLVAGLILHLVHLAANRTPLTGSRPVGKDIALTGDVLADLLLGYLGTRKQSPDDPLCRLAAAEVHAVDIAGHLLQEVFCGFDFRYSGLQREVKEVARSIGHDLFAEALQLLAVDKRKRPEVGIDAATAGINIRQGHTDQLNGFHLRPGIQRTARGIARGLPLPDLRLAGIGREPQLIEEVIHVAIDISRSRERDPHQKATCQRSHLNFVHSPEPPSSETPYPFWP
ncbi:Uncharacterised protein [Klebsiella quasivariicola]|uniref:Uncharacterized protein n=1 Tax=Klebsiella quasivariicola TaxID=2026240 RepID=A0A8B4U1N7_9ENTR|nr:Uncharacterised protein [Klebsiella quasivariicola]